MIQRPQPDEAIVEQIRAIVLTFPEVREHEAWTGMSWRTGPTTFAHIVQITNGWPPAYARAFATDGPATVVTFQAHPDERHALADIGHPFYLPPWRPGIAGVIIDADTDWGELTELLTDSHQICALT